MWGNQNGDLRRSLDEYCLFAVDQRETRVVLGVCEIKSQLRPDKEPRVDVNAKNHGVTLSRESSCPCMGFFRDDVVSVSVQGSTLKTQSPSLLCRRTFQGVRWITTEQTDFALKL